jgi:oligopeptidase A
VRPEHVLPAVRAVLNEEGASLELLEQDLERALVGGSGNLSYSRVFQPYTQIRLRLDSVFTLIEHLAAVADGPALRDALDAAAPLRVKFELRLSQSAPLHTALRRLRRTPELWGSFNEAQRRVLSDTLRGLDNSGVALPPDQRRQFNAIADELSQLSSNYSENVLDATKVRAAMWRYLLLSSLSTTCCSVYACAPDAAGFRRTCARCGAADGPADWCSCPCSTACL